MSGVVIQEWGCEEEEEEEDDEESFDCMASILVTFGLVGLDIRGRTELGD